MARSISVALLFLFIPLVFFTGGLLIPLYKLILAFVAEISSNSPLFSDYIWKTLLFTFRQATYSALGVLILSMPIAYIFSHYNFPLKKFLLSISLIPFALPSIVVVFAFVIVYGQSGFFTVFLDKLGFTGTLLYRTEAIIAAHIFFNLPITVRILSQRFTDIPLEYNRSAALLNLSPLKIFFFIKLPFVWRSWISMGILTFSLCITSFAIIMILGGRPSLTTLEVGIFRALRFEFDLRTTSVLAALQIALSLSVAAMSHFFNSTASQKTQTNNTTSASLLLPQLSGYGVVIIIAYALFLLLPLLGISLDGIKSLFFINTFSADFWTSTLQALFISILLAVISSIISTFIALLYARGLIFLEDKHPRLAALGKEAIWLIFGISPTVLAFAWYLSLQNWFNPFAMPLIPITFIHIVLALPIIIRVLLPSIENTVRTTALSASSINLPIYKTLLKVELPALKKSIASCLGVAFAFSFGEVAVASMFAGNNTETIPLLIVRLMGAYRFHEASLLSLLLAITCGVLFITAERFKA